ncbi:MAG: DNA polymerase III subunit alpha, partial [Candidatus Krumholzibacteria bacterium]|nr:DNA polymerase III subunit alpha [Candidatus Krumholzibacteria bacterium]
MIRPVSPAPRGAARTHAARPSGFTHLHVHSNFSILAGTRPVEDLVAAASRCGMESLALTDTDAMHAIVPFTEACAAAGVRPIYGAELAGGDGPTPLRAVLLARTREGYSEISRLVTRRRLDEAFDFGEALAQTSENVYVLVSYPLLLTRLRHLPNLRAALPVAPGPGRDRERWRIADAARRLEIPTVAAGGIWFLEPREHFVHRVLTAIRTRTTIGTLPRGEAAERDAFFHDPAEVARVFGGGGGTPGSDGPSGNGASYANSPFSGPHGHDPIEEAARIAGDCRVDLGLGRRRLPRFPVPPGEEPGGMLRRIALSGLRRRLGDGCPPAEKREAMERIDHELSVIERKGLAGYFLICWDIVRFACSRGIRTLGRGSAGNSLVSYALGITHFNPLRHDMFFERFLNPEREHLPDFDLDFGTDDREVILRYIFRRYGEGNVAMIGTFSTLRARSALRETAKALGIPEGEIAPLIRMIPFYASIDHLEELTRVSPRAADLPVDEEPLRTLIAIARRIGGFPRHMATHPCGLVVSPESITDLVPLQRGDKGYEITQWSMHEVEKAGLVKIDIIGQKGLAVIGEACAMAAGNEGREIDPGRIDALGDEPTKALIRAGRTEGCFYIESPIMMQLLAQARCEEFEVLTALSSIIRPGVSSHGGKRSYLMRALGLEPVPAQHPAVAAVLRDTYGCLIYQEQVIRLAVAVAGMSYAEADGLRRCMSFKNVEGETMESYREGFMRGARGRGIPEETADEVFGQIAAFAGYAFCKAHSASFALESFESAWCKAHYPAEFMAAVLSNGGGYYGYEEYLEEARRMGLELLPPCVNESGARHHGRGLRLRVGLMQVKGLAGETLGAIVRERPFESLRDFVERVPASRGEVENLIRCGAFACLGRTRPELMWEYRVLRGKEGNSETETQAACGNAPRDEDTRKQTATVMLSRIPAVPDYDLPASLAAEREILDMSVSAHPLAMFEGEISRLRRRARIVLSADLPGRDGEQVDLVGWRVT